MKFQKKEILYVKVQFPATNNPSLSNRQQIQPSQSTASKWASPTVDSPACLCKYAAKRTIAQSATALFYLQLNNRRPAAAHEAVNPKKICCFFCAHFWQISKSSVLDSEAQKGCHFFIQRAKRSFRNALLSGKTEPPKKSLPESPSILLFYGLQGVRGRMPARRLL